MAVVAFIFVTVLVFWLSQKASTNTENGVPDAYKLNSSQITALEQHYSPYGELNDADKEKFIKRLGHFIGVKRIVGTEGQEMFSALEALICAEAIRMTMGLSHYLLPHFTIIMVYPQAYYSSITGLEHAGEVDLRRGVIKLAWTDFGTGISNQADGRNLAIHEYAHAIFFQNLMESRETGYIPGQVLREWKALAMREMPQVVDNEEHFIREYGGTNIDEFFAVSSEHFFEQSVQFKQEHPELYTILTKIYRQDPAAKTHS